MTTKFTKPDWLPAAEPGMRVLVAGATGGLGRALVAMLAEGSDCVIGAHGSSQRFETENPKIIPLQRHFESAQDCEDVVDEFCAKAGGIDALVSLNGGIHFPDHWKDMPESEWERDIDVNLNQPFFLARAALRKMVAQGSGGRIVLNGNESSLHGGSVFSLPYAISKLGTDCMVQGLAREGAPTGILVNGVRLGFIDSGFHERWYHRSPAEIQKRVDLIPLKRGGHPDECAALIVYLLSGWSRFISGQMLALTGGDWL
jgi:3-oxoacyl-[acyl-carrier protein] reductase